MTDPIRIAFGPINAPIDEQLRAQGLKLDMDSLQRGYLQRSADEVTRLLANHILTGPESSKARQRILRIIKKRVKPL